MLNDVCIHTTGRHQIFLFLFVFIYSCLVVSKIVHAKLVNINYKS